MFVSYFSLAAHFEGILIFLGILEELINDFFLTQISMQMSKQLVEVFFAIFVIHVSIFMYLLDYYFVF